MFDRPGRRYEDYPNDSGVAYKPAVDFPNYLIGDDGSVWGNSDRTCKGVRWMKLNPRLCYSVYEVIIRNETVKTKAKVHVLVLEAFVHKRNDGEMTAFRNGNTSDCRPQNLAWGSPLQCAQITYPGVEFRPIPGFSGYLLGDDGTLLNRAEFGYWSKSKGHVAPDGYVYTCLKGTSGIKSFAIHRVVALTFIGQRPPGLDICHNNGISTDNRATNLRYDTTASNIADQLLHGTRSRGEIHPASVLTEDQVRTIRNRYANGEVNFNAFGREYGTSAGTIHHLVKRKTWKHIA